MWFLWYLLIFVTLGPFVAKAVSLAFRGAAGVAVDGLGKGLVRFNVAAVALGLLTLPALFHARGFMGWSLTNPAGFLAPFPDFLVQYYIPMDVNQCAADHEASLVDTAKEHQP